MKKDSFSHVNRKNEPAQLQGFLGERRSSIRNRTLNITTLIWMTPFFKRNSPSPFQSNQGDTQSTDLSFLEAHFNRKSTSTSDVHSPNIRVNKKKLAGQCMYISLFDMKGIYEKITPCALDRRALFRAFSAAAKMSAGASDWFRSVGWLTLETID